MNSDTSGSCSLPVAGVARPGGGRVSSAELSLILQRSDAHVAAELGGEGALVVEAKVEGDVGDLGTGFAERVAGGLDAGLDEVVLRGDAEAVFELAVELALGETDAAGDFVHQPAVAGFSPECVGRFGNRGIGGGDVALEIVALDRAHQADDLSSFVEEREFLRDEPVGNALLIEEEFDDAEERFARGDDLFVIGAEVEGEGAREEIEVGLADDLGFVSEAEAAVEVRVAKHQLEVEVLGEKRHPGDVVEHACELGGVCEVGEESLAEFGSGIGGREASHGSIVWRMTECI